MATEKKVFSLAEGLTTENRFAVIGSEEKFSRHKHAWQVWRTLKQFGCTVYPVAKEMKRLEGSKIYPDLLALKDKVDVAIPCLLPEFIPTLVEDTAAAGIKYIWFQEQTWNRQFEDTCAKMGIVAIRGCVLRHKIYQKPLAFFNPCYWHGFRDAKVPGRHKR